MRTYLRQAENSEVHVLEMAEGERKRIGYVLAAYDAWFAYWSTIDDRARISGMPLRWYEREANRLQREFFRRWDTERALLQWLGFSEDDVLAGARALRRYVARKGFHIR